MSPSVSIELKNVSKHYGKTLVLNPFSLTMPAGCRTVLLGPSGCGKTTMLRMIAGLETPDEGSTILIGGENMTHVPPEKRRIGFMFQAYALFPNMNVEENVAYGLHVRKESQTVIDKTVEEMLELVNMQDYKKRPVQALSGGQRQRVALARALAIRPRILLLDEPLTALDALLRHKVREELAVTLKKLGITAVIVTHDQDEAMVLGDEIVVLQGGKIHQHDTAQNIWCNPATDFVAGFVGGSNKLSATVTRDTLELALARIPLSSLGASSRDRISQANGRVNVFFRPETLSLRPVAADSALETNETTVVIENIHFMGSVQSITCRIQGQSSLLKVNLAQLPAGLQENSLAALGFDSSRLMVFPEK